MVGDSENQKVQTVIIIPTYNGVEFVKGCMDSIRKNTKDYFIVVVDDGSDTFISSKDLESKGQKDFYLYTNMENSGFPVSCNVGINIAFRLNPEYICILNDDTIVTDKWLERMIGTFKKNEKIGIVGCTTNEISGPQRLLTRRYDSQEELDFAAEELYFQNKGKIEYYHRIVGFCMLIKKKVIEDIGYFNEIFSPGNYEDNDYSLRAIAAGYLCAICKEVYIHHFGSSTFKKDEEEYNKLLLANKEKFDMLWSEEVVEQLASKNNIGE